MKDDPTSRTANGSNAPSFLMALAILLMMIYGVIIWLSTWFTLDRPGEDRPIIAVLAMFSLAFMVYLFAMRVVKKITTDDPVVDVQSTRVILWSAVVFQIAVSFSVPIQEVDLYRYIWDGVVAIEGVSPFKYAPAVIESARNTPTSNPEVNDLARVASNDAAIGEVLSRVHFAELPTVYPPTSQFVFGVSASLTPRDASFSLRVWITKFILMVFGLATVVLVILLLRLVELPTSLSVVYAWCPLLVKEVANGGHLDTIAVFLTMAAIYIFCRLLKSKSNRATQTSRATRLAFLGIVAAAVILALAVGAKIYPVVLMPLFAAVSFKAFGFAKTLVAGLAFGVAGFLLMLPMFQPSGKEASNVSSQVFYDAQLTDSHASDPAAGVMAFFKYWEMNDFIFLMCVENLKPNDDFSTNGKVWFSWLPERFRTQLRDAVLKSSICKLVPFAVTAQDIPFLATRLITTLAFAGIAFWIVIKTWRTGTLQDFCESSFLILAWFWLLSPTQNPWYWTWALPLLPFVRNQVWIAMGGLVMIYYFRFWLGYHFVDVPVAGTTYLGASFFDFVVVWFEFGPWFAWLAIEQIRLSRRMARS